MWDAHPEIARELQAFELYLTKNFASSKGSFEQKAGARLLSAGGKRLRPALVIASALGGTYDQARVFAAAAAVETMHTASLVHDDIIDKADTRRGLPTISQEHGTEMAIYTGDYLFARSMLFLHDAGMEKAAASTLAKAIRAMCSGEIEQFQSRFSICTPRTYLGRIYRKTGVLFAASCAAGASVAGLNQQVTATYSRIGLRFGVAFQIRDDLIDLQETQSSAGKPVGNDLKMGLVTLPLLLAAQKSVAVTKAVKDAFAGLIEPSMLTDFALDSLQDAKSIMERYRQKCYRDLTKLPPNTGVNALKSLIDWL